MLAQLSARKGKTLSAELQTTLHQLTGGHPVYLRTIQGRGYKLILDPSQD